MRNYGVFHVFFIIALTRAHEIPMQKAMPPLMDPIPTFPEITHRVYFEVEIEDKSVGKISFGLFGKNAPEAAENFRRLAFCDAGNGHVTGKPLCFRNTIFHRIIPNFAIQGGDFSHGDGTGGEAVKLNLTPTMKELTKFNRPFLLAVAANHKQQAGSQFFVTTVKAQWLTGKHVIFGMVLEGKDVVEEIEKYGTYSGQPRAKITITACGEEPLQAHDKEPHY